MRDMREWLDMYAPFPVEDVDPSTGVTVVQVELSEPLPESWGPRIGDVLHNLRSSLDHLAYALAAAHTGLPLSEALEKGTGFPIFDNAADFHDKRKGQRSIRGIASDAQATIERLQPYQRGPDFGLDPLWLLHQLSNIDKHRRPALTSLYAQPTMSVRSGEVADFEVGEPGPIGHGAPSFVLGTYRRREPHDDAQVGTGFVYDIAFLEPLAWRPAWVIQLLWSIWAHIGETVFPPLSPVL